MSEILVTTAQIPDRGWGLLAWGAAHWGGPGVLADSEQSTSQPCTLAAKVAGSLPGCRNGSPASDWGKWFFPSAQHLFDTTYSFGPLSAGKPWIKWSQLRAELPGQWGWSTSTERLQEQGLLSP